MNTDSASLVLFRLVLRIQILMIPESDTENDTENDDDNNIYTHGDDDDTADADTGSLTLLIMILKAGEGYIFSSLPKTEGC